MVVGLKGQFKEPNRPKVNPRVRNRRRTNNTGADQFASSAVVMKVPLLKLFFFEGHSKDSEIDIFLNSPHDFLSEICFAKLFLK